MGTRTAELLERLSRMKDKWQQVESRARRTELFKLQAQERSATLQARKLKAHERAAAKRARRLELAETREARRARVQVKLNRSAIASVPLEMGLAITSLIAQKHAGRKRREVMAHQKERYSGS